jgi:hypothetical protein
MTTAMDLFNSANQQRAYGTAMLDDLLLYCETQSDPIYYQQIIPLLKAARRFRNIADPGPFFSELRNTADNDAYLKQQLQEITEVLVNAETHMHESTSLAAALAYCAASIMDRLHDLDPNDKIMQIYNMGDA